MSFSCPTQSSTLKAAPMGEGESDARTAYQDFSASWKAADPDIPVLKHAQMEYAKLQ
jgi:hypothetical protein